MVGDDDQAIYPWRGGDVELFVRFAEVLMQLDVVWDLYQMSPEELIAMLPPEFDRFRR